MKLWYQTLQCVVILIYAEENVNPNGVEIITNKQNERLNVDLSSRVENMSVVINSTRKISTQLKVS